MYFFVAVTMSDSTNEMKVEDSGSTNEQLDDQPPPTKVNEDVEEASTVTVQEPVISRRMRRSRVC